MNDEYRRAASTERSNRAAELHTIANGQRVASFDVATRCGVCGMGIPANEPVRPAGWRHLICGPVVGLAAKLCDENDGLRDRLVEIGNAVRSLPADGVAEAGLDEVLHLVLTLADVSPQGKE